MPQATPWKSWCENSSGTGPVAPRGDDARHLRAVGHDRVGAVVGVADPAGVELPMPGVDAGVDHPDTGAGPGRGPGAVAPGDPGVGRRRVDLRQAPGRAVLGVARVRCGQIPQIRRRGGWRRDPGAQWRGLHDRRRIGVRRRGRHAAAAPSASAAGRKQRHGPRRGQPARSGPHGAALLVRLDEVGMVVPPVPSRPAGASGRVWQAFSRAPAAPPRAGSIARIIPNIPLSTTVSRRAHREHCRVAVRRTRTGGWRWGAAVPHHVDDRSLARLFAKAGAWARQR